MYTSNISRGFNVVIMSRKHKRSADKYSFININGFFSKKSKKTLTFLFFSYRTLIYYSFINILSLSSLLFLYNHLYSLSLRSPEIFYLKIVPFLFIVLIIFILIFRTKFNHFCVILFFFFSSYVCHFLFVHYCITFMFISYSLLVNIRFYPYVVKKKKIHRITINKRHYKKRRRRVSSENFYFQINHLI